MDKSWPYYIEVLIKLSILKIALVTSFMRAILMFSWNGFPKLLQVGAKSSHLIKHLQLSSSTPQTLLAFIFNSKSMLFLNSTNSQLFHTMRQHVQICSKFLGVVSNSNQDHIRSDHTSINKPVTCSPVSRPVLHQINFLRNKTITFCSSNVIIAC